MKIKINGKEMVNKIKDSETYKVCKPEINTIIFTFVGGYVLLILFPYAPFATVIGYMIGGIVCSMALSISLKGFKQMIKSR